MAPRKRPDSVPTVNLRWEISEGNPAIVNRIEIAGNGQGKDGKRTSDSQEMTALIAYIEFVGKGTPEGVRLPGMGLMPIALPDALPDSRRGLAVYAQHCASCHGQNGQGEPKQPPEIGFYVPPLWGEGSFNGGAGMGQLFYAASFIRANMPTGVDYRTPTLTVQEAWDVAAYMISNPHPIAPPEPEPEPEPGLHIQGGLPVRQRESRR